MRTNERERALARGGKTGRKKSPQEKEDGTKAAAARMNLAKDAEESTANSVVEVDQQDMALYNTSYTRIRENTGFHWNKGTIAL